MSEWVIPGYTELKELGSGGFGAVMLARHDATGTPVAIKYLRPDLAGRPVRSPRCSAPRRSRSARWMTRTWSGSTSTSKSPAGAAIVMELVDGVTLREILIAPGQDHARRRPWWCCTARCSAWRRRTRAAWCTGITSRTNVLVNA